MLFCTLVNVACRHGLSDEEHAAVLELLEGRSVLPWDHRIWTFPIAAGLVWVDRDVRPPTVRLTLVGRRYGSD
jgi:hypothetical protein